MYPGQNDNSKPPYPGFNVFPNPNSANQMNNPSAPYPSMNPYPNAPGNPTNQYANNPSLQGYGQPSTQYPQNPSYPASNQGVYTPSQPVYPGNYANQNQPYHNNPSLSLYMNNASQGQLGYPARPPPQQDPYMQPNNQFNQQQLNQYNQQPNQYNQQPNQFDNRSSANDYAPSIRDVPGFDGRRDAEVLRKAMKGIGTDEKAIINVLAKRTNKQRQRIIMEYKMLYGKDLISDLKSELSGRLEDVIMVLMTPTYEYDARLLRGAIKGLGTDEDLLIEILSSRSPSDIRQIKEAYRQLFKKDLEKDIIQDTSGHFQRLLVSLSTGMRDEGNNVDPEMAKRDAQALMRAGVKMWGTDESTFNSILASRNFNQLRATFNEYHHMAGHTIDAAIRSEMSGDLANGMLAVAKCAQYRPAYFAERLFLSMKGMGTHDDMLIRIVVTRAEVDMVNIKAEFQRIYGKSLESFISGDCSGDYKKILIALVQGNI